MTFRDILSFTIEAVNDVLSFNKKDPCNTLHLTDNFIYKLEFYRSLLSNPIEAIDEYTDKKTHDFKTECKLVTYTKPLLYTCYTILGKMLHYGDSSSLIAKILTGAMKGLKEQFCEDMLSVLKGDSFPVKPKRDTSIYRRTQCVLFRIYKDSEKTINNKTEDKPMTDYVSIYLRKIKDVCLFTVEVASNISFTDTDGRAAL